MGFWDILSTINDVLETIDNIDKNINQTEETFSSNLRLYCKSFNRSMDSSRFEVTNKLLNKFGLSSNEYIYVAYDDSAWQDGAEGFIITSDGIYVKRPFSSTVTFTSFTRLSNCSEAYVTTGNEIYAGNAFLGSVRLLDDDDQSEVVKLFNNIRGAAITEAIRLSGE